MQNPKVVVIGAGSLFFGRQAIWQMVHSPHLHTGTLALVDTDAERLDKMARLAAMVIEHNNVPLKLEASTDRRDVLPDSDFVVLSFADRSVKFRGIDCQVSEKYGIRMCSGDTVGPGGIFRTMREFPVILQCADDIDDLCPDAWTINYVNPTAVHGLGLRRFAPQRKSFALCDGQHMPYCKQHWAVRAGLVDRREDFTPEMDAKFDLRIAGVNHFTWMVKAEYDGRDVMPDIAADIAKNAANETAAAGDSKASFHDSSMLALYEAFGCIPTCTGHTKEYVRFWQGHGTTKETIPPLAIWNPDDRYPLHDAMWKQVDELVSGQTPIEKFDEWFGPDMATDIIETMVADLRKPFYINTANDGAVTNLPDDAFLELLCDVDIDGPRPRPVGPMPLGVRGMQQLVLDTHELTAEAVATRSHDLLRRAMLTDPLANAIGDSDAIIRELLDAERDALPPCWFK